MKSRPTFREEKILWEKGYKFVIGVDEVGRGAFAGPVTVGAAVFDKVTPCTRCNLDEINDSKLLSAKKREKLSPQIKKLALLWLTASVSVSIINKIGIGKATQMAFRKSLRQAHDKLEGRKLFVLMGSIFVTFEESALKIKKQ